jgi:5-methylcytosine-specific restriction endonuclease McrA
MTKKSRIPVPEDGATLLMFRSDRTCCVCHVRGEPIQIHHIDEDPSNNDPDNLAVLCFHCHDETQITGGFGRKLDAAQVTQYRDDWHRRVEARREAADNIALAREAGQAHASRKGVSL